MMSQVAGGPINLARGDKPDIKCAFYYLNIPSIQGMSGGGVYNGLLGYGNRYGGDGKTYMLGIMHGTKGDNTGGKLAVVTPSYYIWDLLNTIK